MDSDNIAQLFDPTESAYVELTEMLNNLYDKYDLSPSEFCNILDRYQFTLKIEMYFPELPQFIEDCYDD